MTGTFDFARQERRAARLSVLLAAADVPARAVAFPAARIAGAERRGVLARRLRVAAAVALLMVGLGVPPVRAWIAGSVRTIWTRVLGRTPVTPATPTPAAPAAATLGTVTVAASPEFTVRVATRQSAGVLTVVVGDGESVSASVDGRAEAAELTVFPDGIRIANARTTTTGYQLRVPLSVSRLVVRIGRESPRIFHPAAAGERWVVDLHAP